MCACMWTCNSRNNTDTHTSALRFCLKNIYNIIEKISTDFKSGELFDKVCRWICLVWLRVMWIICIEYSVVLKFHSLHPSSSAATVRRCYHLPLCGITLQQTCNFCYVRYNYITFYLLLFLGRCTESWQYLNFLEDIYFLFKTS